MSLVTESTARRLYAVLAQEQRRGQVPSLVAALTRDRALVWRDARGDTTGEPGLNPADLQYRIGSITKTMTAVLLLQLRDEGALALNDPVSAYLPEVEGIDVTLRGLLSHSAGLPAEPQGDWWERSPGQDFDALVTSLGGPLPFAPGRTHHYSNLGYGLLGEVVSRLRGQTWWECLSARVLEPLNMLRTSYDPFDPHAQGYSVHPYSNQLTVEPAPDTGSMAPAGQVWSTVLDLATYADFLIGGHPGVLAESSLEEMATPLAGTSRDGAGDAYGLGLRMTTGGSGTLVGHTGSMPGFQAALFVDRPRRAGAVVLANSTTGLRSEELIGRLFEVLEDSEPTIVDAWVPPGPLPAQVGEVLGLWHWGNTPLVSTWDGSTLTLAHARANNVMTTFDLTADGWLGTSGHQHGEPLHVVRRDDGSVSHLVCTTFVLTRTPYDPSAPIPGGAPTVPG